MLAASFFRIPRKNLAYSDWRPDSLNQSANSTSDRKHFSSPSPYNFENLAAEALATAHADPQLGQSTMSVASALTQ